MTKCIKGPFDRLTLVSPPCLQIGAFSYKYTLFQYICVEGGKFACPWNECINKKFAYYSRIKVTNKRLICYNKYIN